MSRHQPRLHDRLPNVVARERDVATGRLSPLGNGDRRGKRDRTDSSRRRRPRISRATLVATGAVVAIATVGAGAAMLSSGDGDDGGQTLPAPADAASVNTADAYAPTYELTWSVIHDENPASPDDDSGVTTASVECTERFGCSFLSDQPIPLANFVSFTIGDDLRGSGREETPIPEGECDATRIVEIAFEPVDGETVSNTAIVSAFEGTIALTWEPSFAESGCDGTYASTVEIGGCALDAGATPRSQPDAEAGYVGAATVGGFPPVRQAFWDGTALVEEAPFPDDSVGIVFDCIRSGCTYHVTTAPDATTELDGDHGTGEQTYEDQCGGTTWTWSFDVVEWQELDGIRLPALVAGSVELTGGREPLCSHREGLYEGTLTVGPTQ